MNQYRNSPEFKPTCAAAIAAVGRVNPLTYSKTRNFLDGAVTHLSPWITHGFISTKEVASLIHARQPMSFEDKLIFELGWREFFKHVHGELGDGILKDIRRPVWNGSYARQMPLDILEGRTGVEAIDKAVRLLYETGYLHNHARMWIASYTVHLRKVSWRAGADWMYSHLLDGDLASNHLSWQWVAGTFSHKPYVFNAENVHRFARQWNCANTSIDTSYEELDAIARGKRDIGPERRAPGFGLETPGVHGVELIKSMQDLPVLAKASDMGLKNLGGRQIELVHPWDLGRCAAHTGKDQVHRIGVFEAGFHRTHPWNARRWSFVLQAMQESCEAIWIVNATRPDELSVLSNTLKDASIGVSMAETLNPGYAHLPEALGARAIQCDTLLPNPTQFQPSFSRFYKEATHLAGSLEEALGRNTLETD